MNKKRDFSLTLYESSTRIWRNSVDNENTLGKADQEGMYSRSPRTCLCLSHQNSFFGLKLEDISEIHLKMRKENDISSDASVKRRSIYQRLTGQLKAASSRPRVKVL
jgi:hypothetical protein